MAHFDLRTRVAQLGFMDTHWFRLIQTWCRDREVRGPGALVGLVDEPDQATGIVPFGFMPRRQLENVISHYSGSAEQQMVRRAQPGGPVAVFFIHTAGPRLWVDSYEIRVRTADD